MRMKEVLLKEYGPVMDMEEMAKVLRLKKQSMYQQLYNGKMDIPHARLGKRYLFPTEEVADYIDQKVSYF